MGLKWVQISIERVRSEQDRREANSRHRGVPRLDLGRFRTVETRQSVHGSVIVHRNNAVHCNCWPRSDSMHTYTLLVVVQWYDSMGNFSPHKLGEQTDLPSSDIK